MSVIWKYKLEVGEQQIHMPWNAVPLHVDWVQGGPRLWCEVNPSIGIEPQTYYVYETGQGIPPNRKQRYVGTVITEHELVYHVYKGGK